MTTFFDQPMAADGGRTGDTADGARAGDLAAHFMECGALDANLTLGPGARLVITDDFLGGGVDDLAALGMAAVVARDGMVARAALLPLGMAASRVDHRDRAKYEKLFALIEENAFDTGARESAEALLHARFREARIRDLAQELGGTIQPARQRYRAFLDIVTLMAERRITERAFLDEFLEFTRAVAGKLDFGIYAMCVDRLFVSPRIPMAVKLSLLREVLRYPPQVRKELVTTLMASPAAPAELRRHAQREMASVMTRDQLTEIVLFTTLKLTWQAQRDRPRKRAG